MLAFHKKWYSSNIMNLVVTGKHSIDQLEKWVIEKFSAVENKNVELPNLGLPKMPFTHENLGIFNRFRPIKDEDALEIIWLLPCLEKEYLKKPLSYFTHLFGHEGENSLLSYLKEEGLAMALSAGSDHELSILSTFYVEITLTKKGLENYEDVLSAVFKYAQRLKEVGPQQFVFDEC